MALAGLDGVIAGAQPLRLINKAATSACVAGRPTSLWNVAGVPGPGTLDATANGVVLSSTGGLVNGQLPLYNPGGGLLQYLNRFSGWMTSIGTCLLLDRLWHNGTVGPSGAATIVTPTLPARDVDGAALGNGVFACLEIETPPTANVPTLTITYTNQAGASGHTATNVLTTVNNATAGTVYFFGLQAGDTGIRSIESIATSASWTSVLAHLVLFRILGMLELPTAAAGGALDIITGAAPRLYDGTVPYVVLIPNNTTAQSFIGTLASLTA